MVGEVLLECVTGATIAFPCVSAGDVSVGADVAVALVLLVLLLALLKLVMVLSLLQLV